MDRWRSAPGSAADRGSPSASTLREKVFEQDRRGTGVDVLGAAELGLARGMALVVELHRESELLDSRREAAYAFGLVAFLSAQRQGQSDNESVDLLSIRDLLELGDVLHDAPSRQRAQWPHEAMGVIAHGDANAAVADIQRKVAHRLRRA